MERTAKFQVIMLPTSMSKVVIQIPNEKLFYNPSYSIVSGLCQPQHVYIVDNYPGWRERFYTKDWFIFFGFQETTLHQYHSDSGYGIKTLTNYNEVDGSSLILAASSCSGRIVATTNKELKLPGISDDWLIEHYIPSNGKIINIELEIDIVLKDSNVVIST